MCCCCTHTWSDLTMSLWIFQLFIAAWLIFPGQFASIVMYLNALLKCHMHSELLLFRVHTRTEILEQILFHLGLCKNWNFTHTKPNGVGLLAIIFVWRFIASAASKQQTDLAYGGIFIYCRVATVSRESRRGGCMLLATEASHKL